MYQHLRFTKTRTEEVVGLQAFIGNTLFRRILHLYVLITLKINLFREKTELLDQKELF